MEIIGHGIDIVSIERLRRILDRGEGTHFEARVFSEHERSYCRSKADPVSHFAARFAAKEAYGKALGLGLGPSGNFTDIEVVNNGAGVPSLRLSGRAQEVFSSKSAKKIFLSISHDGDSAIASVIICG